MTTEIEKTKREMYKALAALKAGGRWLIKKANCEAFESALEEHLEALHNRNEAQRKIIEAAGGTNDLSYRLGKMTQERDDIQGRLHAIDHAYCEQSNRVGGLMAEIENLKAANAAAGEELRETHMVNRSYRSEIRSLRQLLGARDETIGLLRAEGHRVQGIARQHLDDCRSAEKLSDDFSEKLTHATTVIGQQEQLISGQRSAIATMHAELTHSRIIRAAFQRAQGAFSVMDAALHESAPYAAQKALGDDLVGAEFQP